MKLNRIPEKLKEKVIKMCKDGEFYTKWENNNMVINPVDQDYCPKNVLIYWSGRRENKPYYTYYNPANGKISENKNELGATDDSLPWREKQIRMEWENRIIKSLYCKPITIDGHEALEIAVIWLQDTSRVTKDKQNNEIPKRQWSFYGNTIIIFKEYDGGFICWHCNGELKTNSAMRDALINMIYAGGCNYIATNAYDTTTYVGAVKRICNFFGVIDEIKTRPEDGHIYLSKIIRKVYDEKMKRNKSKEMELKEKFAFEIIRNKTSDEKIIEKIKQIPEVIDFAKRRELYSRLRYIRDKWCYYGNYNHIAIAEAGEKGDIIRRFSISSSTNVNNFETSNLLYRKDGQNVMMRLSLGYNKTSDIEEYIIKILNDYEIDMNLMNINEMPEQYVINTDKNGKTIITSCRKEKNDEIIIDNVSDNGLYDNALFKLNDDNDYKSNLKYIKGDDLKLDKVIMMLKDSCVESMEKSDMKQITGWITNGGRASLDTLLLSDNDVVPIPNQKTLADKLGITSKQLKIINDMVEEENKRKEMPLPYYYQANGITPYIKAAYILRLLFSDDIKSFPEDKFKNMIKIANIKIGNSWYYSYRMGMVKKLIKSGSVVEKIHSLARWKFFFLLNDENKILLEQKDEEIQRLRWTSGTKEDLKKELEKFETNEELKIKLDNACDTLKYIIKNFELKLKDKRETLDTINQCMNLISDTTLMNIRLPEDRRINIDIKDMLTQRGALYYHDMMVNTVNEYEQLAREEEAKKLAELYKTTKKKRKHWEYKEDDYSIILPENPNIDLPREGKLLNHCVSGYVERHVKGDTTIMFLRENKQLEVPFYTIEIKNNTIWQIHGNHNRWLGNSPEAIPTVMRWIKKNEFQCEDNILLSTAQGYGDNGQRVPKPEI